MLHFLLLRFSWLIDTIGILTGVLLPGDSVRLLANQKIVSPRVLSEGK
jgi:hypothetical protein